MEKDDFVFIVPQVAHSVEKRLLFFIANEGIGKDDNERPTVELLGGKMYCVGKRSRTHRALVGMHGLHQFVEKRKKIALMDGIGAARSVSVYTTGKQCQSECVALTVQYLY